MRAGRLGASWHTRLMCICCGRRDTKAALTKRLVPVGLGEIGAGGLRGAAAEWHFRCQGSERTWIGRPKRHAAVIGELPPRPIQAGGVAGEGLPDRKQTAEHGREHARPCGTFGPPRTSTIKKSRDSRAGRSTSLCDCPLGSWSRDKIAGS